MNRKYWVIGGEYDDGFARVRPGTEQIRGPFSEHRQAMTEWRRLTFAQRTTATTRYSIAAEG